MRKRYIKNIALFMAAACMMSSCIDLEELNQDPNNSSFGFKIQATINA